MARVDVVELTQRLIVEETVNPPGMEHRCIDPLHALLAEAGFAVRRVDCAPGRPNLVARLEPGRGGGDAIAFTGHLDVVPLGDTAWSRPPFAGVVEGDRLYGRGASDMKGGVAAVICAALRFAADKERKGAVELALTSSEEIGLLGAKTLRETPDALGAVGALVVAEPTSNAPLYGHRGVLWGRMRFRGKTAHASTPEHGDNAIARAARALARLETFDLSPWRHARLGAPSFALTTIKGGGADNAVPDLVSVGFDCRPTPGLDARMLAAALEAACGEPVEIDFHADDGGFWTEPDDPWARGVHAYLEERLGRSLSVAVAPYSTDAAHLTPAYGDCPTLIIGPGEAEQAHQTDEWCSMARLREAEEIYLDLMRAWRG